MAPTPSQAGSATEGPALRDEDPRHPDSSVQAVGSRDQLCASEQKLSSAADQVADFAESSTADEFSTEFSDFEQPNEFVFEERASKLVSNDTRLVKRKEMPLGDFAFMLVPKRTCQKKKGSGVRLARGLCHIQVKKCEGAAAAAEVRIHLREGERPIILRHDFSQSPICEVPEVVDLQKLVDAEKGTFAVRFLLISLSS